LRVTFILKEGRNFEGKFIPGNDDKSDRISVPLKHLSSLEEALKKLQSRIRKESERKRPKEDL
jgi:hypothetical protein